MPNPNEKGGALVLAMLILLLVGTTSAHMLTRFQGLRAAAEGERESLDAFYAAEGALELARHRLSANPRYEGGLVDVAATSVSLEVEGLAGRRWKVTAVALPVGTRLEAVLAAGSGLPRVIDWRQVR